MNLVTFSEPVTCAFKKSAGGMTITFEAGREYLLANAQLDRLMQDENVKKRTYKVSKAESRIRNFLVAGREEGQKRLLLFNGSGGYGDQIMTWPVAKILSQWFDVHILTDPGNNVCWWNLPFVKSIQTIPIQWEMIKMYDYFVPFEAVVNMDEHQDQGHPVDMMLHKMGLDPSKIPAEAKTVKPNFTYSEMASTAMWKDKRVGLYQLSSANPVRCLPVGDSVYHLLKLAEATPEITWLGLYDEFVPKEYKETLDAKITESGLKNLQSYCFPNLRELWVTTQIASVVVSPDSMMAHIAGSFGTPCVGLWGPISPDVRVKYYKNHYPIYHREFCVHAPCFCYMATFPKYCPARPTARTACEVLAGIATHEIIDLVKKVAR